MPSFAKIIALLLVLAWPTGLCAQPFSPDGTHYGWADTPPAVGHAPQRAPSNATPLNATPPESASRRYVDPQVHPTAYPHATNPQDRPTALPGPGRAPLSLKPPGHSNSASSGEDRDGLPSIVTVAGSLGIVLGIFLLFAWAMRRAAPAGSTMLPGEVFEVLGRAPMGARQQVHLLRCGAKLVLVSVTPAGTETLTEITDAQEVDRLAGLCRQARPNSATAAFRQVFQQVSRHGLEDRDG